MSFLDRYEPQLRSILRIVTAFTLSLHGWQKFFGVLGGMGGGRADLSTPLGIAGVIETFGGAFLFLGLFTRPVAFVVAGELAVGYFMAHAPNGFWPLKNGGELAVIYSFLYLWMSSAGGGPWSIDALMGRKS